MSMRDLADAVGLTHQAIKKYEDEDMYPNAQVLVLLARVLGVSVETLMSDSDDVLLETLATLEHEQWAHWTRHMLYNLTPENIARWRQQIDTPYAHLSDQEKESARQWARKIITILQRA
jgi:transcriptional regulator with XRE-family HTH domain